MKKLIIVLAMLGMAATAPAQAIYQEVARMERTFEQVKNDPASTMDERRVASFKLDATEYILLKAKEDSTFTETQLGLQVCAMVDYVNLYLRRLDERQGKGRDAVISRFSEASLAHSLFHDTDRAVVMAYADNAKFPTPFSLDTDWVKALDDIRQMGM